MSAFDFGFKILKIVALISIVGAIIGMISFGWTISTSPYLATLSTFISIIVYILPIGRLAPIITIFIASMAFRFGVSVLRSLWDLIPIRG